MKTIKDFNFSGKKALVRVDFNVPQDDNLNVSDNTRIVAVKPTVDRFLPNGGSSFLLRLLGRQKGKFNIKFLFKTFVFEVFKF